MGWPRYHGLGRPISLKQNWVPLFQNFGAGRGNGITVQCYIHQILRPHSVPFYMCQHCCVFQQHNAPSHTAKVTMAFLCKHKIRTMLWPAFSLDLNPIWNMECNSEMAEPDGSKADNLCRTGSSFPQCGHMCQWLL